MNTNTKERLLAAINTVVFLEDYDINDCFFSLKYPINSTSMVYILLQLMQDFNFKLDDAFVDAMENATFSQWEALLEQYENTNTTSTFA